MSDNIEQILKLLSSREYKPITESDIRKKLGIKKHQRKNFYKDLKKLRRQKKIVKIAKDRYVLAKAASSNILRGFLKKRDGKYVLIDGKNEYILPRLINPLHAVVGDEIIVKIEKRRVGFVAKVSKIVFRKYESVIGYIKKYNKGFVVEPVDRNVNFIISIKDANGFNIEEGLVVFCEIVKYPTVGLKAVGKILKVYGHIFDSSIDMDVVIDKFSLPHIFSDSVEKEVASIKEPSDSDYVERKDFRKFYTITIDGADAKDFDDAIDIEKIKNEYRLYVHIADVSHYVKPHSPLDQEAFNRGFSVYFPDGVIPMLPHQLSDNVCSLVPHRDRLSVSVVMDIDLKGKIKKYKFTKSVIQNKNRMTYKQVQGILDGEIECDEVFKSRLFEMRKLAKLLRRRRFNEGSIDLNVPEPEFVLNDKNEVVDIKERPRLFAHYLIEEFMLAANLSAADFLSKHYGQFIRRVHDEPDVKKISNLAVFLKRLGIKYNFDKNNISSKDIQRLIESIKDKSKNQIISYLVLRSLKRAEYSLENKGHFALGFKNYTHFTSPIRRYSDLVVHRMIKAVLDNYKFAEEELEFAVDGIRNRELVTEEAMFYMDDVKSAAFMNNYLGEIFDGVIVSIIPSGMFVRLNNYFVDGFVAAEKMEDDYYEYHEELFAMIGRKTHKVYRIGDSLKVIAVSVNKFAGEVDFVIA